jgi:hypothetical protein
MAGSENIQRSDKQELCDSPDTASLIRAALDHRDLCTCLRHYDERGNICNGPVKTKACNPMLRGFAIFVRWAGLCGVGWKSRVQRIMASEDEDVASVDAAMGQPGGHLDSGRIGKCEHRAIGR